MMIVKLKIKKMINEKELFDDKNFDESSEMSSLIVEWGQTGDYILGTFIRVQHDVKTQFGINSIYHVLAEKGSFHKLIKKKPVANSTTINKGETWSIWGRGDIFDGQMNTLKPGQIVKIIFAEEKETDMGTAKIVKVYAPKNKEGKSLMNKEWLDEQMSMGV